MFQKYQEFNGYSFVQLLLNDGKLITSWFDGFGDHYEQRYMFLDLAIIGFSSKTSTLFLTDNLNERIFYFNMPIGTARAYHTLAISLLNNARTQVGTIVRIEPKYKHNRDGEPYTTAVFTEVDRITDVEQIKDMHDLFGELLKAESDLISI